MTETKKDLENIKSKLIEHIKLNYEKKQAEEFIQNIKGMNDEEFIKFLKEQGLVGNEKNTKSQCIFCSIVFGDIPSTKIGENEKAIAILDIKPASLGHTLIIPKEHIESKENLPGEVGKLATEIQEKLKKTFNPKRIDLISSSIMGHEVLNVLPVYKNETLDFERKNLSIEEIEKVKKEIEDSNKKELQKVKEKEPSKENLEEEINEKNTWLPKRIP